MQNINPTEDEVVGADVIFASGADDRWTVFEEDMLLDAVEHHGFGSWYVPVQLKLETCVFSLAIIGSYCCYWV